MQRICASLAIAGYDVLLVGRKLKNSIILKQEAFKQKRLQCFFTKRLWFYTEYNLRLFFYLLFIKMDLICAIDLDTILPCYFASELRKKKRVYDAHELFTEMKEVITRPPVKKIWMQIERFAVPKFKYGYTVSYSIAEEFKKRYDVAYEVIRNVPIEKKPVTPKASKQNNKVILYQGAVNEARGLENLISAMQSADAVLHIYGDGNVYEKIKKMIAEKNLQYRVLLKGKVAPEELPAITQQAYIGINLVEPVGLNQIYSLANKFFDYMHAHVPQVTMNFPEYKYINDDFEVAVLINTIEEKEIIIALNLLLNDAVVYNKLKHNCTIASEVLNWRNEEKKLIEFYSKVLAD